MSKLLCCASSLRVITAGMSFFACYVKIAEYNSLTARNYRDSIIVFISWFKYECSIRARRNTLINTLPRLRALFLIAGIENIYFNVRKQVQLL